MTALLESSELIVRGDIQARIALPIMEHVTTRDDNLEFVASGERIQLALGAAVARRWVAAIAAPKPALARKLGITAATRLHITGSIDDDALRSALVGTEEAELSACDLAIVRTDDRTTLTGWLAAVTSGTHTPPAWIVYVKGRDVPLGESGVRTVMIRSGFIDTKVAAVSERLTALRFVRKR